MEPQTFDVTPRNVLYLAKVSIMNPRAFFLGIAECRFEIGLAWPDDEVDKGEAYDSGRTLARALLMLD